MPMKHIEAEFSVKKISDTRSDISMSMDFTVKGDPLGWLLGATLLKPILTKKVLVSELLGIAYYAKTGKSIGKHMPNKSDFQHSNVNISAI